MPDTAVLGQSVLFGISRHRGSAFENSFKEELKLKANGFALPDGMIGRGNVP
jgi:hypothetical protein